MTDFTLILVQLLVAHILGDFLLQPTYWVKQKERKKIKSVYLYLHVILHGVLAYVFIGKWGELFVPVLIMSIHFSIDVIKLYQKKSMTWFIIDQFAHVLGIVIIWAAFYGQFSIIFAAFSKVLDAKKFWLYLMGYVIILQPVSIVMYQLTKKWNTELEEEKGASLKNAGKWIGMLERVLILTFILINQFTAIGFLLAAKSIFRFGDLTQKKDRKLTEYILIGSLLSFTVTILVGVFLKFLTA